MLKELMTFIKDKCKEGFGHQSSIQQELSIPERNNRFTSLATNVQGSYIKWLP